MEIISIIVLGACLGLFGLGLALENLDQGRLERNIEIADPSVFDIFQELHGLKFKVVAGVTIIQKSHFAGEDFLIFLSMPSHFFP